VILSSSSSTTVRVTVSPTSRVDLSEVILIEGSPVGVSSESDEQLYKTEIKIN